MEIKSSAQVLNTSIQSQKSISDEVTPNRGGGGILVPDTTDSVTISSEAQALSDEATPYRGGGSVIVVKT